MKKSKRILIATFVVLAVILVLGYVLFGWMFYRYQSSDCKELRKGVWNTCREAKARCTHDAQNRHASGRCNPVFSRKRIARFVWQGAERVRGNDLYEGMCTRWLRLRRRSSRSARQGG